MSNLFIFFLLLIMDINGIKTTSTSEGDWLTLTGDNYTVEYPATWEPDQSGVMGASFILFAPLESDEDQFRENVNLLIQDLTGMEIDLDLFTAVSEDQIKTMVDNSTLIESVRIKSDSGDYQKIIYSGEQGTFHLKYEQYYWMINEHAYILTFTAEQDKFDAYKETGEHILNSFSFKK